MYDYVVWLWSDDQRRLYYIGRAAQPGISEWHADVNKAMKLSHAAAKIVADNNDAQISLYDSVPKGCNKCGEKTIIKTRFGDICCARCMTGVTSPLYTGTGPVAKCPQCGRGCYAVNLDGSITCWQCGTSV